ncbi:hypothetical protein B5M47_03755, partial [candidate division CPR3 bacterium 4484_211]
REGDLKDRPRTPKRQPSKTPSQIEDKVIEVKNQTGVLDVAVSKLEEAVWVYPMAAGVNLWCKIYFLGNNFVSSRIRLSKD